MCYRVSYFWNLNTLLPNNFMLKTILNKTRTYSVFRQSLGALNNEMSAGGISYSHNLNSQFFRIWLFTVHETYICADACKKHP